MWYWLSFYWIAIDQYFLKTRVKKECYDKVTMLTFENEKFCAPAGYDTILTQIYGNYMQLPPKEKQQSHHFFHSYKLI